MTRGNYASRLHWVGIVTLAILIVGLSLFGWSLRPASGGFPEVPSTLQLFVAQGSGLQPYTVDLTRTGDDAATVLVTGPSLPDTARWELIVNNLGSGRLCSPSGDVPSFGGGSFFKVQPEHLNRHPHYVTVATGTYHVVAVDGRGTFYVELCWSSDAPIQTNGAYLSARFPPLLPYAVVTYGGAPPTPQLDVYPRRAVATRQLNLGSGTTADFNIQSQVHPTSVTTGGWQWWPHTPAEVPISFSAVNTSDTQHDSYQAFLSGIVFGVAGGALIAIVQELVAPFRSRQELRPPEPGG